MIPNDADPDCNSFLFCTQHEPVVKHCASGLRFDPSCSCCNHAASVQCGHGREETTSAATKQPIKKPIQTQRPAKNLCDRVHAGTTLPNPKDETCISFVVCSAFGKPPSVKKCPSFLRYNPVCKCCDYPQNVVCNVKAAIENSLAEATQGDDGTIFTISVIT